MMKKLISIVMIVTLCLGLSVCLSGCSHPVVSVSSVLEIDEGFAGTRTVSIVFPRSVKIDSVKDTILEDDPSADIKGVSFEYTGVEDDGYYFELKLSFRDKEQYEEELSGLLSRSTSVFLSRKNTMLTKGTRMSEDFDVSELVAWVERDTKGNSDTDDAEFDYTGTAVKIGSDSYTTASTVNINDCTGSTINAVSVKTSNDKAGHYSRTFSFTVPNDTYSKDKDGIKAYFLTNTLPESKYAGWSHEGSNMVYTVIYEDLSLKEMQEATAKILDTDSVEIFYGDKTNASTPLSEGLTFEENLDTFSFIGPDNGFPTLNYSYSLPLNTTYGEGMVFSDGHWINAGEWTDDMYSVSLKDGAARLRIPDGIQYKIEGIEFELEPLGDSRFKRTTEFVYDKKDGKAAADYAVSYFESKDIPATLIDGDSNYMCRVVFEGTTDEITDQMVSVFGSGNFLAYEKKKGTFDLSIKTELTDYVDIGYMLNAENAECPMHYTVRSGGGENIVSVSIDGSETEYTKSGSQTMTVKNGTATIKYHGNIPVTSAIVIYVIAGSVLLILTAFIAVKLIRPKRRRRKGSESKEAFYDPNEASDSEPEEPQIDPTVKPSLVQTTTFSIFELNTLLRNKKYVDEINKDIEERMHAQSIEEQKNDIRERELKELSRKVYGDENKQDEDVRSEDGFIEGIPAVEAVDEEEIAQVEAVQPERTVKEGDISFEEGFFEGIPNVKDEADDSGDNVDSSDEAENTKKAEERTDAETDSL